MQERESERSEGRARRRRRRWRTAAASLLLVLGVILAARLALPGYLRGYVNRTLDQSPEYDGRIGDVDVHLLRGAYTVRDVNIVKTTGRVPVPFFEGRRVDFSVDWSALFKGHARGQIIMDRPKLNFVDGPSPEETQTGADQPWLRIIDDLFPFRIDQARINQGQIWFRAFHTEPPVDVYLSELQAEVRNLTNVENRLDPLIATVTASGAAMESGDFELEMSLDPQSHRPNFTLATRLLEVDAAELTELTQAYGGFEFERGSLDLVVELRAKDGFLTGYVKPLLREAQVIGDDDFEEGNPLEVAWEGLLGITGELFENQPRDQLATTVELEGHIDDPRTDILEIVGGVLRNAFIEAYLPEYQRNVASEAVTDEGGE